MSITKKSLAQHFVDLAEMQLGVRESGSNTGAKVREYQSATTLSGTGWPWCAALIAWGIRKAEDIYKINIPWTFSASCDVVLADLKARGLLRSKPEAGGVFLVRAKRSSGTYSETDAIHIGWVTKVQGDTFWTVEGNTNNDGGREGYAVMSHKRTISNRYYFASVVDGVKGLDDRQESPVVPYKVRHLGLGRRETPIAARMLNGSTLVLAADFAKALGKKIGWNGDDGEVLLDGQPIPLQPRLFDGRAWFPIRDLAKAYNLEMLVNVEQKMVTVK